MAASPRIRVRVRVADASVPVAVTARGNHVTAFVSLFLHVVVLGLHCQLATQARLPSPSPPFTISTFTVYLTHDAAPPVLLYEGTIPGYRATAPPAGRFTAASSSSGAGIRATGRQLPRVDTASQHVRGYASYLRAMHARVAEQAGVTQDKIIHSYTFTLNAFAARLTPSQVRLLQQHPSVAYVQRDRLVRASTMYSPKFINVSSGVWPAAGGQSSAGKGIIIGVIDTGVWPEHPSFSDAHMSDATIPIHWTGKCVTSTDFPSSSCNKKLIGARFFKDGFVANYGFVRRLRDYVSPRDGYGHGTWCASAAAGAPNVPVISRRTKYGPASGIAPGSFLAVYKALWSVAGSAYGVSSDINAAIEQAVMDGCDVISMSLGGGYASYFDDIALLNAAKAGVYASLAAGNAGNPMEYSGYFQSTLDNAAPFYLTVGASTTDRTYTPFTKQARFTASAPEVTSFSSLGPLVDPSNTTAGDLTNDILKPDVMGPGNDLWGAWRASKPGSGVKQQFDMISGTSMATPHLAGIGALLMQLHPTWTPAQIKSAIMTTGKVLNKAGKPIEDYYGDNATPWMMGSGQVDGTSLLDPGLTFDTSYNDYVSFLAGQEPDKAKSTFGMVTAIKGYQLNQPNIVVSLLSGAAAVTRTVTNVGAAAATYTATISPPSGATAVVQPTSLTLSPGQSGTFTVTMTVTSKSTNFSFGTLLWSDGNGHTVRCVLGVQKGA